jgi:hypothetical protein
MLKEPTSENKLALKPAAVTGSKSKIIVHFYFKKSSSTTNKKERYFWNFGITFATTPSLQSFLSNG